MQREREIIFDPLNLNPFPDNPAGLRQRRRATKAVWNELLRQCAHTRGHAPVAPSSTAEATISASVVKRRDILRMLFTRMMDAREDASVVIDLLPKTFRMKLRTLAYIVSRLKRAFARRKGGGSGVNPVFFGGLVFFFFCFGFLFFFAGLGFFPKGEENKRPYNHQWQP